MRIEITTQRTNSLCPTWEDDLRRALELALDVEVELEVRYAPMTQRVESRPQELSVEVRRSVASREGASEALVRKVVAEALERHQRILDEPDEDRPKTSLRPW